jgi:hypothetical protein
VQTTFPQLSCVDKMQEIDEPKRIGLSDMDTSKYMTFGSLFILAVDTSLFPLDTLKTIIMSERVHRIVNYRLKNYKQEKRITIYFEWH